MKRNSFHIDSIIQDHGASIKRLCVAYLGNDDEVDDLYQEVLVNIWSSISSFKRQSKLSTWIYRVTVNTAITFRKKRDRKNLLENQLNAEDLVGYDTSDKDEQQANIIRVAQLQEAINMLKNLDKLIIGLVLESVSYKEIADIIGKDTSFVGVKISRIKTKLQKHITSQKSFEL